MSAFNLFKTTICQLVLILTIIGSFSSCEKSEKNESDTEVKPLDPSDPSLCAKDHPLTIHIKYSKTATTPMVYELSLSFSGGTAPYRWQTSDSTGRSQGKEPVTCNVPVVTMGSTRRFPDLTVQVHDSNGGYKDTVFVAR